MVEKRHFPDGKGLGAGFRSSGGYKSFMKVSVITPSFQNSDWLKLCVESVADQGQALQEHIVQDACSTDGTADWLKKEARVRAFFEKDEGMYDAVNRGFDRAQGEILAYLNCDEQYLPGALEKVVKFFERNPQIQACVGDTVVVDGRGNYLCHRLGLVPGKWGTWVRFPVVTSSLFFRRSLWANPGVRFDVRWKIFGDLFFVLNLLQRGTRFGVLPEFLSVFSDHGENLYLRAKPEEVARRQKAAPNLVRIFYPCLLASYGLRILLRGGLAVRPFSYAIYSPASVGRRRHDAIRPTLFWAGRSRWKKAPDQALRKKPN